MKNNIPVERAIKNFTQEDVAKKIAVSRQTTNAMEANTYVPSTVFGIKNCKAFRQASGSYFYIGKGRLSV
jgi:putative transcriptional regulator